MKTIAKGKERFMAEIKANDRGYFQGSRSKSKRKKR